MADTSVPIATVPSSTGPSITSTSPLTSTPASKLPVIATTQSTTGNFKSASVNQGSGTISTPKPTNTTSPTVISNADVNDKTIPNNTATLAAKSNTGITVGADGVARYANGTVAPNPTSTGTDTSKSAPNNQQTTTTTTPTFGINTNQPPTGEVKNIQDANGNVYGIDSNGEIVTGPNSGQYQVGANISQYSDLYKQVTGKDIPTVGASNGPTGDPTVDKYMGQLTTLMATADAHTATQIQNIQATYTNLINQQQDANTRSLKSINQTLALGGSSQYAPLSSQGIVDLQVGYGIQQIADLQSKEQAAITAAQQAQDAADYKTVDTLLQEAEKVRDQKQAAIDTLNKTLADQANKAAMSNVVSGLLGKGITDPKKILDTANSAGANLSASDVDTALKALAPEGNADKLTGDIGEYFNLVKAGIPLPSSVASLPAAQQPYAYVAYKADLARKASTAADKTYSFSTSDRGSLLGSGLTNDEISHIQDGINQYGIKTVLDQETGLSPDQKDAITQAVVGKANQFLTSDWITANFDADKINAAAKAAGDTTGGFFGFGASGNADDYIKNTLMPTVQTYRDAGLSDKEIFTKLQTLLK